MFFNGIEDFLDMSRLGNTIQSGFESDVFVGSSLINMYTKCVSMEDAFWVFKKMPSQDVVSWNASIIEHVKHGQGWKALKLFQQM